MSPTVPWATAHLSSGPTEPLIWLKDAAGVDDLVLAYFLLCAAKMIKDPDLLLFTAPLAASWKSSLSLNPSELYLRVRFESDRIKNSVATIASPHPHPFGAR